MCRQFAPSLEMKAMTVRHNEQELLISLQSTEETTGWSVLLSEQKELGRNFCKVEREHWYQIARVGQDIPAR